jgi:predicted transport protein
LDENNCPVIIEYKRATNENVINQGLFYLDWLLDHKAEFTLLAMQKLGSEIQAKIDWSSPRLLCIAGNYTKYDEHAVQQINRNIELFRYQKHEGFLVLELVNATTGSPDPGELTTPSVPKVGAYKTVTQYYEQKKTLKLYFAFRRIKNFACVEIRPQMRHLLVFVKVDPQSIALEEGFTRDVSSIGHFGTGDLEITIASSDDFEKAKSLLLTSYESA